MRNERIGRQLLPGFLVRLLHDSRGNTLALIAAAVIPMAALAGSAIDMARFYVVKVRLQQACDAGVLAGRKFMDVNNSGTTLDATATKQAQDFFKNNYRSGWFATDSTKFTPTKTSDSQVAGTATTTVPLTVMQMFGFGSTVLSVSCKARYDVADADIMFVLDTTGSMGCTSSDTESACDLYVVSNTVANSGSPYVKEKSGSRIQAVRDAMESFYDTVTKTADPTTHFRFGYVPYSSAANVGKIIPTDYITTAAHAYQSRTWSDTLNGSTKTSTSTNEAQSTCNARAGHAAYSYSASATPAWTSSSTTVNSWTKNSSNSLGTCNYTTQPLAVTFHYAPRSDLDVASFITAAGASNPTSPSGGTSIWRGCVEDRQTDAVATFDPLDLPDDLDPDLAPTSDSSRWSPMWTDAVYARPTLGATTQDSTDGRTYATRYSYNSKSWSTVDGLTYNSLACPKQAQRLKEVTSKSDVVSFVEASDFTAYGNTYHDVGMNWGLRFLSPTGPFKDDTSAWPGRNSPNRFIVFLTDGNMEPSSFSYASHGLEYNDQRVTKDGYTNLEDRHNARFLALCQAAKNRNIKVFTIAFASTITDQLKACASPNSWYYASDSLTLTKAFQSIAQQVAMLRIDQ